MIPVTVISATRYNEQDFFAKAALGRALSQTYAQLPVSKRFYFENRLALGACYNDAVERVTNPDEVLMFVHDDVHLLDFYWVDKLMAGLEKFACVGLAGNKRRVPKQPNWAFIDEKFTWDDRSNLSGIVGHGTEFPCRLSFFGPVWQECKLLDGLLLAAKRKVFNKGGIRFDEAFDFHFYDLDFCRQAEAKRLSMGTIALGVMHEGTSRCGTPPWQANYEKYLKKWRE
jgi:glycosyl transferase family 2